MLSVRTVAIWWPSRGDPIDSTSTVHGPDPLGMPLDSYRAIAWELDEWTERLAEGLAGPLPLPAQREGT